MEVLRCDQCGRYSELSHHVDWYVVGVLRPAMKIGETWPKHFCGVECLSDFALERINV